MGTLQHEETLPQVGTGEDTVHFLAGLLSQSPALARRGLGTIGFRIHDEETKDWLLEPEGGEVKVAPCTPEVFEAAPTRVYGFGRYLTDVVNAPDRVSGHLYFGRLGVRGDKENLTRLASIIGGRKTLLGHRVGLTKEQKR